MSRKKKRTVNQTEIKRMKRLSEQPKSTIEGIAEKLGRDPRTIRKYLSIIDFRQDELKILRKGHLERVIAQMKIMRSCLEHLTLNDLPDHRDLLDVRGYDWRLDPAMWFYLCTPDFSNRDLWGTEFPRLESHMKESPFWEHLKKLEQAVKNLEKNYDIIALKLSVNDQRFKDFWKTIQIERLRRGTDWGHKPSRTAHNPEPAPEDFKPYYDQDYAKEVMERFHNIDNGLFLCQFEFEKMLDQLYIDLLPDEINPIIVTGHCDKCPYR
jgi:hypothetical protein